MVAAQSRDTRAELRVFRVRLKKRADSLPEASEVACEQIVQVPKRNFLVDEQGVVRPIGERLDDAILDSVIRAVVNVVSP